MKKELFEELVESIKEGGRILKGAAKSKRSFKFDEPDVCAIRERLGLSQHKFSALLGISTATLRNWEQRRRKPAGAARALLQVIGEIDNQVYFVVYTQRGTRIRIISARRAHDHEARAYRQSKV